MYLAPAYTWIRYCKFGNLHEVFILFAYANFHENKTLTKRRNTMLFTDIVNHALVVDFNVTNMSFNAICKIKFSQKFLNVQYWSKL